MKTLLFLLLVGGLAWLLACEGPCEDHHCPQGATVTGTSTQFVLGPQEDEVISISAPEACRRQYTQGHRVLLTTYGDTLVNYGANTQEGEVDGGSWLREVVEPALQREGIEVHAISFGTSCVDDEATLTVGISDWGQSNDAARVIGRAMRADDLNAQVELQIIDELRVCPDQACHY